MRRMVLLHFLANAVLLGVGYYWLGVTESKTGSLLVSMCMALFLLIGVCWTYSASLRFLAAEEKPWLRGLSNLPAGISLILLAGAAYWGVALWADYSATPAFQVASFLTMKWKVPVKPTSSAAAFNGFTWLLRWMVIPSLILPAFAAVSVRGWKGLRPVAPKWNYWLAIPVLLWLSFRGPILLILWVPAVDGFLLQSLSLVLRAALGYLLFGAAWLLLAFLTVSGKPVRTQENTVVSP